MSAKFFGKRVLIVGAARQGLALARYLVRHGAEVVLNDVRPAEQMQAARAALADLDVAWVLGAHPLHLLERTDLLCISGGVPLTNPLVVEAHRRGLPVSNDTQVFMEAVPCPTVGITGSAGKTTTTTLVGRMAKAQFGEDSTTRVWVGGNIGDPLISYVDEMKADDLAILEMSSFQLDQLTVSPQVGVILNITPNHLDRHGNMEAYTAAKARMIAFQYPQDIAILGRDDAGAWSLAGKARGRLLSFGTSQLPERQEGTFVRDGEFYLRLGDREIHLPVADALELRGEHNRLNVLAACVIAHACGVAPTSMRAGVEGFGGVAHRLEFVRTWSGADWYNDSIATAPERTLAAIRAFESPLILMLGGRDKDLPWSDLASTIRERVDHVVIFGEAGEKISAAIGTQQSSQRPFSVTRCAGLQEAVKAAARIALPGYVVLLSPGGTSFDEFRDFEERGERFREWVTQLP